MTSTKKQVMSEHKIQLLDTGLDSLKARINLIRSAKKTIELEFFIFDLDDAARLMMHEMIDKSKAGVKVRLLIDFSQPIFKLSPAYAKYLEAQGIEVKYYNTAPLYRFARIQHRSHRKILIADDQGAIIGGRNVADEYFDMDPRYNFIDTDILIKGEIVSFIREGFDQYFVSELATKPDSSDVDKESYARVTDFFKNRESTEKILAKLNLETLTRPEHTCNDITFVTDPPSSSTEHRQIYSTMVEMSKEIKSRVDMESPYFVIGDDGYDLFKKLSDNKIEFNVLTNSLLSTDATYVVSSLVYKLHALSKLNMSISVMNGKPVPEQSSKDFVDGARWGLHSKRMVIDNTHVLVGTYNIDPRSANLNSELIVVCRNNPALAREVLKSMDERMLQARRVLKNGQIENFFAITEGASAKQKIAMVLLLPLTNMFGFLL